MTPESNVKKLWPLIDPESIDPVKSSESPKVMLIKNWHLINAESRNLPKVMSSPKVATFQKVVTFWKLATFQREVTISNLPVIVQTITQFTQSMIVWIIIIMVQIKGRNGGELDATTEGHVPDNSQKNSERNLKNSSLLTTWANMVYTQRVHLCGSNTKLQWWVLPVVVLINVFFYIFISYFR